jgi:hypothetical protein
MHMQCRIPCVSHSALYILQTVRHAQHGRHAKLNAPINVYKTEIHRK